MKKVGDVVYWEYIDGTIGSAKILDIVKVEDNGYSYIRYDIEVNGVISCVEDHNCLPEDDPRVQEYIRKENEGLWIARCKNQALLLFDIKPVLREGIWQRPNKPYGNWWELPAEMYPEVTFENSPKKLRI